MQSVDSRAPYIAGVVIGVLWGIPAAAIVGGLAGIAAAFNAPLGGLLFGMMAAMWSAMAAGVVGFFAAAPIAAVVGKYFYEPGEAGPASGAIVGAVSAALGTVITLAVLYVLLLLVDTFAPSREAGPVPDEATFVTAVLVTMLGGFGIAAFCILSATAIGAFGGFMAGRYVERELAAAKR